MGKGREREREREDESEWRPADTVAFVRGAYGRATDDEERALRAPRTPIAHPIASGHPPRSSAAAKTTPLALLYRCRRPASSLIYSRMSSSTRASICSHRRLNVA